MKRISKRIAIIAAVAALGVALGATLPARETVATPQKTDATSAKSQSVWLETLLTDTPQEGRELAVKLARRSIATIQTDPEIRKQLRSDYDTDTEQLILSAQVIATEFQTIAAANNYWRD